MLPLRKPGRIIVTLSTRVDPKWKEKKKNCDPCCPGTPAWNHDLLQTGTTQIQPKERKKEADAEGGGGIG